MTNALTSKVNSRSLKSSKEGENVLLSEEKTIYLIDTSTSMSDILGRYGQEGVPTKIAAVRTAMKAMMEARLGYETDDHVGIVSFGGSGRNFTHVHAELEPCGSKHIAAISRLSPGGNTPMYQGLEKATHMLADADGLVRVVLMSDGEPNNGYTKTDIIGQVKKMSQRYGFVVDTVGIGGPDVSHYDEKFMQTLAFEGAGQFFPIDDVDELVKLLKKTAVERKVLFGSGIALLGDGSEIAGKAE